MKKIESLLLGVILFILAGSHEALAVCGNAGTSLDAAGGKVQKFIQEMKIAKARGDIETMSKSYVDTYEGFLKQCTAAEYQKLCAFDCHIEVGEYNLFMANELSYYYTTSQNQMLKPEAMLKYAQEGVNIMENARKILSTHSTGDFRDYVFKGGRYNLLLARLYTTIGDIWYQSVSELKLQRLQFLVNEATGTNTANDGKKSEAEESRANYEKANWVIQSAAMELPMDDKQFSEIAADIFSQRYDIQKRLASLNKGFIFLDIDPEEFVQIPVASIKARLGEIEARIESAERSVELLMSSWKQSKLNRDTDQVNDEARKKEISISQSSYRVAQLEGIAQNMADQIGGQLDAIKAEQQTLDYEKQKFEYEFGLKMKVKELRDRQELIALRKDADIVQFKLGDQDRKLNDLRWLMGWEISLANLQIQLSQFESEITRYKSEIQLKKNQITQVTNRQDINKEQIKISKENTTSSKNTQTALYNEKDRINVEALKSLNVQICAVQNRMKFLGMPVSAFPFTTACTIRDYKTSQTSYHDQMCGADGKGGLRNQLAQLQIRTVAEALCVLDPSMIPADVAADPAVAASLAKCSTLYSQIEGLQNKSQIQFARDIWNKEMELAQKQIDAAESTRAILATDIAIVTAQILGNTATLATTESVELALEAQHQAALAIPETYACACGMSAGAITKVPDVKESLQAAVVAVREKKASWQRWVTFLANSADQVRRLTQSLKDAFEAVDQGRMAKGIKNLHAMQAMTEMIGKGNDLRNDLTAKLINQSTTTLDCERNAGTLLETQASLQAEFDRLVTEVNSLAVKNDNIQLAYDRETSVQTKETSNTTILELENTNLGLDINSLNSEITTLNQLITDTESRKKIVSGLQGSLDKLQTEQDATKQAIDELERLRQGKLLAISDAEYEQINKVIENNGSYTEKLLGFAAQVDGLTQLDAGVRKDLNDFKLAINKQVADERGKIMNTIYLQQQDANSDKKTGLFMATEEQMAAFTKGVPAFIAEKRALMEEANRLLVLLRNQVKALVSLQGGNPLSLSKADALIYVKNKDDLQSLKKLVEDEFWSKKQQIVTQSTHILVPSGSGLGRTLASEKRASFEISPFARGRMKDVGFFSLWNDDFDADDNGLTQNLLLVDLNLLVDFPACANKQSKRFVITHKGEGVVFKETSESDPTPVPTLVSTEARSFSPSYAVTYAGSLLAQTVEFWGKTFYLNNFLQSENPPNFSSVGSLPVFLGLPVLGQYEVLLSNAPQGCSYENASFDFYITYATTQRAQ